jgi:hypothetical protein
LPRNFGGVEDEAPDAKVARSGELGRSPKITTIDAPG